MYSVVKYHVLRYALISIKKQRIRNITYISGYIQKMVSELTIAEQTDLWHHMADLNLRQEKKNAKPNQILMAGGKIREIN
jgi:hypothetical protein